MSYRTNTLFNENEKYTSYELKLFKQLNFAKEFSIKIDMEKVSLSVMKPWITQTLTDLIGFEDDVVIEFVINMLQNERYPDPKRLQVNLTGFLAEKTPAFVKELWKLLLSAQETVGGVPAIFIEAKKSELAAKKAELATIADTLKRAKLRQDAKIREEKAVSDRQMLLNKDKSRRKYADGRSHRDYRNRSRYYTEGDGYYDRHNRSDRYKRRNVRYDRDEKDTRGDKYEDVVMHTSKNSSRDKDYYRQEENGHYYSK